MRPFRTWSACLGGLPTFWSTIWASRIRFRSRAIRRACLCRQMGSGSSRYPNDRSLTCGILAPTARKQGQEARQEVALLINERTMLPPYQ